jgi:hypothetical protein
MQRSSRTASMVLKERRLSGLIETCSGNITKLYQLPVLNNYSASATKPDAVLSKSTFSSANNIQSGYWLLCRQNALVTATLEKMGS